MCSNTILKDTKQLSSKIKQSIRWNFCSFSPRRKNFLKMQAPFPLFLKAYFHCLFVSG